MKKILFWGIIIILVVAVGIWLNSKTKSDNLGAGFLDRANQTLAGSSSNYVSLPKSAVFADATTTDDGYYADGGDEIMQVVNTSGIRKILLKVNALGGTATSTMYIRQMGSFDGTNYYYLATSTSETVATSTKLFTTQRAVELVPGTASTTVGAAIPFEIDGWKYTRFIMWAEDVSTDPDDGIQAWVSATLVEDIAR